jgi:DNA-binding transcriptional MerR regulator
MTTSEPRAVGATEALPVIPVKRYFTIGEVSELCQVKPHVLRYWEQEFAQLRPVKRRGNRRYYQHHEVLLIRKIRSLLYDEGFTISGARSRLTGLRGRAVPDASPDIEVDAPPLPAAARSPKASAAAPALPASAPVAMSPAVRSELEGILALLRSAPKKRKPSA